MRHAQAHDVAGRAVPRSTFYDSPFGRMFGRLEPWRPAGSDDQAREDTLRSFARAEMVEAPDATASENKAIPAGYTYFGQFVDHDITFDPTSSVARQNDPNKLKNFRTPRLDLDSVYGSGPEQSRYLYDPDNYGMFIIGKGESDVEDDLPRIGDIAVIGDPRNDENIIVSQIQLAFLKLHNRVLAGVRDRDPGLDEVESFHRAQRIVQWFYQYVVWNDWIRLLVHDGLHSGALETRTDQVSVSKTTTARVARRRFYQWKQAPYIPVEFSVAAYRFGHSMVRPGYLVNSRIGFGSESELPIFADPLEPSSDLRGGRPLPAGFQIQWDWFFSMRNIGSDFPQNSRRIDTKLSAALSDIPMGDGTTAPLAFLNLRRGWRMELPSGPAVADALGVPMAGRPPIEPGTPQESLWFYILRESNTLGSMSGKMLGPVGGTIVAEVFAGLLDGDPLSFTNLHPLWTPASEPVLIQLLSSASPIGDDWGVADLLVAAGVDEEPVADAGPIVFPGTRGRRRIPSA